MKIEYAVQFFIKFSKQCLSNNIDNNYFHQEQKKIETNKEKALKRKSILLPTNSNKTELDFQLKKKTKGSRKS